MSPSTLSIAERSRSVAALRGAIAWHLHHIATLASGLVDLYSDHPTQRGIIGYVSGHFDRLGRDLATLVTAERKLAVVA